MLQVKVTSLKRKKKDYFKRPFVLSCNFLVFDVVFSGERRASVVISTSSTGSGVSIASSCRSPIWAHSHVFIISIYSDFINISGQSL